MDKSPINQRNEQAGHGRHVTRHFLSYGSLAACLVSAAALTEPGSRMHQKRGENCANEGGVGVT